MVNCQVINYIYIKLAKVLFTVSNQHCQGIVKARLTYTVGENEMVVTVLQYPRFPTRLLASDFLGMVR